MIWWPLHIQCKAPRVSVSLPVLTRQLIALAEE